MVAKKTAKAKKATKKSIKSIKSIKKETPDVDPSFAPVVAAFVRDPQVQCGRMFSSNSVLNVKGKIFAMLSKGNLVVKLPKPRVDAMVSSGEGKHFDPGHGRLMKEWIVVNPGKLDWIELAREAHRFVRES
jgi:hypothetical protein